MIEIIIAFLSFLAGLAVGAVSQKMRYQYNLRQERITDLMPYFERGLLALRKLLDDVDYAISLQEENRFNNLDTHLLQVSEALWMFHEWFAKFLRNGKAPHLRSMNISVLDCLKGMNEYTYGKNKESLAQSHGSLIHALKRIKQLGDQAYAFMEKFVEKYGLV